MIRLTRLAVVAGLAIAPLGCGSDEPYQKPRLPVRVEIAQSRGSDEGIRYAAALEPDVRVDLAFKVGGYVGELAQVSGRPLQDGDRVSRGMVLARLRQDDVEAKLAQARSQQAEAEAGLRQAQQAYERARALLAAKSITRPDFEAAQAAYEGVQAKLAGARALVQEASNAVADSALRAPIDGLVLKRLIEVGSLVGPGTPGFILADTSNVKAAFGVPDVTLARVRARDALVVTLEAFPDREFTGRVSRISPVADMKTRNFDVEVTIPNPGAELKVGMVASLVVSEDDARASGGVVVPLTAVLRSPSKDDGYAVAVVAGSTDQLVAQIRDVELGEMIGNRVEVTRGVRSGERVVITGANLVVDGAPVAIVP